MSNRKLRNALIVWIAIFSVAVGYAVVDQRITSHKLTTSKADISSLKKENRSLIATQRSLIVTQRASCQNFEVMKASVNEFHGTIRKFLQTAYKARVASSKNPANPNREQDAQAARVYAQLIASTHLVSASCAQEVGK